MSVRRAPLSPPQPGDGFVALSAAPPPPTTPLPPTPSSGSTSSSSPAHPPPRSSNRPFSPLARGLPTLDEDDVLRHSTIHGRAPSGRLTLIEASSQGNVEDAVAAIARGESVRQRDSLGRDAISQAVLGGQLEDLLANNDEEDPEISERLSAQRLYILTHLLLPSSETTLYELNAPRPNLHGATVLGLATYLGKQEVVERLLSNAGRFRGFVAVDGRDAKSGTALMYAARDGHPAITSLLLERGARPDLFESNGESGTQYALNRPELLWLFEQRLRQIRSWDQINRPAHPKLLSLAFLPPALFPFVPRIPVPPPPEAFASSSTSDDDRQAQLAKLLLRAVRRGEMDLLKCLLFAPAPFSHETERAGTVSLVNSVDSNGLALLHHALRVQPVPKVEVIRLLWQAGADINLADVNGGSPVHQLACLAGRQPRPAHSSKKHGGPTESEGGSTNGHDRLLTVVDGDARRDRSISGVGSDLSTNTFSSVESGGPQSIRYDENMPLADHDEERQLKELIYVLIWELGADPDLRDSGGAIPLHFAAQFGRSRSVLRALLRYDYEMEDRAPILQPLGGRGSRISGRCTGNAGGLTPREVCRKDLLHLFQEAEDYARTHKENLAGEAGSVARISLRARVRLSGMSSWSRESGSSFGGTFGTSARAKEQRHSVKHPLAALTTLDDAEAMQDQVLINLEHVDENLSSPLLVKVKNQLVNADARSTFREEPDTPSEGARRESVKRLRLSLQSSSGSSGNRFRPVSASTGSSWWSSVALERVFSRNDLDRIRTDLDQSFRLFSHSSQMLSVALDFYTSQVKSIQAALAVFDAELEVGQKTMEGMREQIAAWKDEEARLHQEVYGVDEQRQFRFLDMQVSSALSRVLSDISAAGASTAPTSLTRSINIALETIGLLRMDVLDFDPELDRYGDILDEAERLVEAAETDPGLLERQTFRLSALITPASSKSSSSTLSARGLAAPSPRLHGSARNGPTPDVWRSWPRLKEEQPEWIEADMNREEIIKDLTDLSAAEDVSMHHEQVLLNHLNPVAGPIGPSVQAEVFRLLSIVLNKRAVLQAKRVRLEEELERTEAIMYNYETVDNALTNDERLAATLRLRLSSFASGPAPEIEHQHITVSEVQSGVSFQPPSKASDPFSPLDLRDKDASIVRRLEILGRILDGSEDTLDRALEDYNLIETGQISQVRSKMKRAAKHIIKAKAALSGSLQARMDELVSLWEFVGSSESDAGSILSGTSSYYLDHRVGLASNLVIDPVPNASGSTRTAPSIASSSQRRMSTSSMDSGSTGSKEGSLHSTWSGSNDGDLIAFAKIRQNLSVKVHVPLESCQDELTKTATWIGIVREVLVQLEGRFERASKE